MNRQTKYLRTLGRCTKQVKGQQDPDQRTRSMCRHGVEMPAQRTGKDHPLNTGTARAASGRKPWKGGGDPLKRGKLDYNFTTPDPYGASYFRGMAQAIAAPVPRRKREVVDLIGS